LGRLASGLIVATLIIVFLYMGRGDPRAAGHSGTPRLHTGAAHPVAGSLVHPHVLFAIGVIAVLGPTIVFQVAQFAEELPKYETNFRGKIRSLGGGLLMSSSLEQAPTP
jgi:hypothetical protein